MFHVNLLSEWVRQILGVYESSGLLGARQFMADVDRFFLGPMRGESGVAFDEISVRMVHYLRGISGRSFEFGVAPLPSTDTRTIFLPGILDTFPGKENNIFLYKFLVSLQLGHVDSRIFPEVLRSCNNTQDLFSRYPDRQLAVDLFSVIQFIKVFHHLELELPGLIRQGRELCCDLFKTIAPGSDQIEKSIALQNLLMLGVSGEGRAASKLLWMKHSDLEKNNGLWTGRVLGVLSDLYETFTRLSGSYRLDAAALLLGEFNFARAAETISLRRDQEKEKFVAMLAGFLEQQGTLQKKSLKVAIQQANCRKIYFFLCRSSKWRKTQLDKMPYFSTMKVWKSLKSLRL